MELTKLQPGIILLLAGGKAIPLSPIEELNPNRISEIAEYLGVNYNHIYKILSRKPKKNILTYEQAQAIAAIHQQMKTVPLTAEQVGMPAHKVREVLRVLGIYVRKGPIKQTGPRNPEKINKIIRLRNTGMPYSTIGKEFGCTKQAIHDIYSRYNKTCL